MSKRYSRGRRVTTKFRKQKKQMLHIEAGSCKCVALLQWNVDCWGDELESLRERLACRSDKTSPKAQVLIKRLLSVGSRRKAVLNILNELRRMERQETARQFDALIAERQLPSDWLSRLSKEMAVHSELMVQESQARTFQALIGASKTNRR